MRQRMRMWMLILKKKGGPEKGLLFLYLLFLAFLFLFFFLFFLSFLFQTFFIDFVKRISIYN